MKQPIKPVLIPSRIFFRQKNNRKEDQRRRDGRRNVRHNRRPQKVTPFVLSGKKGKKTKEGTTKEDTKILADHSQRRTQRREGRGLWRPRDSFRTSRARTAVVGAIFRSFGRRRHHAGRTRMEDAETEARKSHAVRSEIPPRPSRGPGRNLSCSQRQKSHFPAASLPPRRRARLPSRNLIIFLKRVNSITCSVMKLRDFSRGLFPPRDSVSGAEPYASA